MKISRLLGRVAALALTAGLVTPALALDDLSLNVAAGSQFVRPGDTVLVTLDVANLTAAINGAQVLIRYDDTILTLIDVIPTDLGLTSPNQGWVEVARSDDFGDVTYAVAVNGGSVLFDHTIATFQFTVVVEGTTSVVFRPDSPPFFTKLTQASDNETILPNTFDSGLITSNCDDGLFCNGVERFDGVTCQPGTDPCDDGVACTVDTCDDVADTCTNTPDDTLCDNGLFCDGAETCDGALGCQSGTFPCDDLVGCTDDACDEVLDACTNIVNDANCDDGLFCTGVETCDPALDCQNGPVPNCDDGVGCTVDTCDDINDTCASTADDTLCDNGVFCDGAETCDSLLDCQASTDPCFPLSCDEATDTCFAPIHITGLEVFYAGRFLQCRGGTNAGTACTIDTDCDSGICSELSDPNRSFLAGGSTATIGNITNYIAGITGIRILFDTAVTFATTPDAALSFASTTGIGTTFSSVSDVVNNISVVETLENGLSVITIVINDDYIRSRWLEVTIDATQVTAFGVELDGEVAGNPVVLPSGDGTPGGNAVFYIGNVAGDADRDRTTLLTDIGIIRGAVNPFVTVPITDPNDVDKDGKVLLTDVGDARAKVNPFLTLPLITIP